MAFLSSLRSCFGNQAKLFIFLRLCNGEVYKLLSFLIVSYLFPLDPALGSLQRSSPWGTATLKVSCSPETGLGASSCTPYYTQSHPKKQSSCLNMIENSRNVHACVSQNCPGENTLNSQTFLSLPPSLPASQQLSCPTPSTGPSELLCPSLPPPSAPPLTISGLPPQAGSPHPTGTIIHY